MSRNKLLLSMIITALCSLPALAEMSIAVMDFEVPDRSLTLQEAAGISELVRTEMINIGLFRVIERAQVGKVLREQGFQQTGCTDVSCAIQIGQLLSAKKILVGTIMKMGDSFIINGRIVDVEKGTADYSSKEKALSKNELDTAVEKFVIRLADNITMKAEEKEFAARWKQWKEKRRKEEAKKSGDRHIVIPYTNSYDFSGARYYVGIYGLTCTFMGGSVLGAGAYLKWKAHNKNGDYLIYGGASLAGVGIILDIVWIVLKVKDTTTASGDFRINKNIALITPLSIHPGYALSAVKPYDFNIGVRYLF